MRKLALILGALVVGALLAAAAATAGTMPSGDYRSFSGTITGTAQPVYTGGRFTRLHLPVTRLAGRLGGTVRGDLKVVGTLRDGTTYLSGTYTWAYTSLGTFKTTDAAVITRGGTFTDTMRSVAGGPTGHFMTRGVVDVETGAYLLVYYAHLAV